LLSYRQPGWHEQLSDLSAVNAAGIAGGALVAQPDAMVALYPKPSTLAEAISATAR
jgi:hypothetical protein